MGFSLEIAATAAFFLIFSAFLDLLADIDTIVVRFRFQAEVEDGLLIGTLTLTVLLDQVAQAAIDNVVYLADGVKPRSVAQLAIGSERVRLRDIELLAARVHFMHHCLQNSLVVVRYVVFVNFILYDCFGIIFEVLHTHLLALLSLQVAESRYLFFLRERTLCALSDDDVTLLVRHAYNMVLAAPIATKPVALLDNICVVTVDLFVTEHVVLIFVAQIQVIETFLNFPGIIKGELLAADIILRYLIVVLHGVYTIVSFVSPLS